MKVHEPQKPTAAIPALVLVAALAAIYLTPRRAPHIHVAAVIVLILGVIAIVQVLFAARAAETAAVRLGNLASSSRQWKDAIRMIVVRVAEAEGYQLHKILADAPNFEEPSGGRIFVFVGKKDLPSAPIGLLLLTTDDFAALSRLETRKLDREIHRRMFDRWGAARFARHRAEVVARITDTAARLYSLQFFGVGFKVSVGPDVSGGLQARIGPLDLEFSRDELANLVELPFVQMNLRILEALAKIDPSVEQFTVASPYGKAAD